MVAFQYPCLYTRSYQSSLDFYPGPLGLRTACPLLIDEMLLGAEAKLHQSHSVGQSGLHVQMEQHTAYSSHLFSIVKSHHFYAGVSHDSSLRDVQHWCMEHQALPLVRTCRWAAGLPIETSSCRRRPCLTHVGVFFFP